MPRYPKRPSWSAGRYQILRKDDSVFQVDLTEREINELAGDSSLYYKLGFKGVSFVNPCGCIGSCYCDYQQNNA